MDIVYTGWLYNHIRKIDRTAGRREGLQVIQVGDKELDNYRMGHIPGAIYLDTNTIERAPSWNVIPGDQLEQALLAHGIHSDKIIVLNGRDRLAVARTALVLMYAGVRDVRIFWGGIEAWRAHGYQLETGTNPPIPVNAFGRKLPAHPEYIAGMEQVRALLADQDAVVACVRTWEEFVGKISGYDYIKPRGRIPGSVWAALPGTEAYRDQQSQTPDSTARLYQEIVASWREQGLTPDKKIVFYCGTGWRASEAFLYACWIGWKDICIYDGGWLEWSAQADNPIEVGEPRY
jgi:thiosulfate/3-mercaptopyruvate sulfurtransferase